MALFQLDPASIAARVRWIAALFVGNALGYFAGARVEGRLMQEHPLAAMLLWGACYGLGLGAGLGVAFHFCQRRVRELFAR